LSATWSRCVGALESELPEQQFNTWVRPLQAVENSERLRLLAPNRFVVDWVRTNLLTRIEAILRADGGLPVTIEIGSREVPASAGAPPEGRPLAPAAAARSAAFAGVPLNANFTFGSFIEGKSNHFAKAAAQQVAENPGSAYNPLFIYGGVGLGKTHLMHAIGHLIRERNPDARIAYVHSERFVSDMVRSLQHNTKIGRAS